MRLTSPARRAAGLLAVTTIGLSTAVLSVTGVASAAPLEPFDFTTDTDATYSQDELASLTVPDGYCSIDWLVYGASGGSSENSFGVDGGGFQTMTTVVAGDVFAFTVGEQGGDAEPGTPETYEQDGVTVLQPAVPGTPGAGGAPGGAAGTGNDADGLGGGGGGLTTVTKNGASFMSAFGGDGGSDAGKPANGGAGAGNEADVFPADPDADDTVAGSGPGAVTGIVIPCAVPAPPAPVDTQVTGAPQAKWVYGVKNGLDFQLTTSTVASDDLVKGVEYSLDGGTTWTAVTTVNQGDYQYEGTITGLTTGKTYSVTFRFATAKGHTAASSVLTGSPAVPGPAAVTAVAGASQIKVSWTAPENATGVAGYRAFAGPQGQQSSDGSVFCMPTTALGTSCVLGATPGVVYVVGVESLDADGNRIGVSDRVTTEAVPATAVAASLPKADGTLTSDDADGKVVAGEKVTISGKDFLPGSTVQLLVYSDPVSLGTVTVLSDGTFSATVTLPKDLANGVHHLVATGVDVNGNVRNLVVEVTVSGGTAVLAFTGFSPLPFVGAGVLALGVGGGLLVASRRRAQ
ncbi:MULTISPECIES: hypothetical protein [unclassified Modestobacter]|uniref:hypothetical protein n=1 Tax=unclassified Modestobacter TaxID=2643866 RepID=UPI0022AAEA5F|nr:MULTISPECIES: hypothetical protein [unclassified Modestobacter]MCZ2813338.1 hypothetical protein [Modestobacter sp. VKM Ac-2979]MCZ2842470.1 hypothetical protein [Modestobacter sp. VKM Ac-2980]MCZ2846497.1 hypothetical protein [Modestobacter sp. VKM Ac-2978]